MNGKQTYTEGNVKSRFEQLKEHYDINYRDGDKSALESQLGALECKQGECWCCAYGIPYYIYDENNEPRNKNTLLTRCMCREENKKQDSIHTVARVRKENCEHWILRRK